MMGKRSNFERKPRDFYPTPYEGVVPLLPHLKEGTRFDEPCMGGGELITWLESHGHHCIECSDVAPIIDGWPSVDALNIPRCDGDMFITNPPWSWPTLSKLIPHLANLAPTWLLLNADLMHNKRMGPFMKYCRKVVSVGRVSWMQNGKKGFENCAWYLFDNSPRPHHQWLDGTVFYGRGE